MGNYISPGSHRIFCQYSHWLSINLKTSPQITFINICSIITKKNLIHNRILASLICLLQKNTCYIMKHLIERSRRTSNPADRSSRISNSAGHLLFVTWFELFSRLATPRRSYARKIQNHSSEGPVEWKNERTREFVRTTSRMKKPSVRENSERPSRIRSQFCKRKNHNSIM